MVCHITVLPEKRNMEAAAGETLLSALRAAGLMPDAPCGGQGTCGKCKVLVGGQEVLACRTVVSGDMTVTLPESAPAVLTAGVAAHREIDPLQPGLFLAFDIGTTTIAGILLDETGKELAAQGISNPQASYGADVISRIRHALAGQQGALTETVRTALNELTRSLCASAGVSPEDVGTVSIVGNPTMQQLYLGYHVENLAQIPFAPVLTRGETVDAAGYLPALKNAKLLIVPDIAGFVGADTVACVLATGMAQQEEITLMVDIGTNGEMVLGNSRRMAACATAAGPALEGANIRFGMRGQTGAIDHVRWENGELLCSVIGGGAPKGICGSGLIDALAVALARGWLNARGKILTEDGLIHLAGGIYLDQEDVRQVQLAKGAIAAGIEMLAQQLGIEPVQIHRVCLAGAFGTYMDGDSACRIGLLPPVLRRKIQPVGNAALSGSAMLACDKKRLSFAQQLTERIEFVELASLPGFPRSFAGNMRFRDWMEIAREAGFDHAAALDVATLKPRADVRDMCAADKCGAYGKNWTCPPHCGDLSVCAEKMQSYRSGILLQTAGALKKTVDTKAYRETEQRHLQQFARFCQTIREEYPGALCLGSGGCRICETCAYPEPCRFPEKAVSSMEAYGLFVTQVCRDNGLDYHRGDKTVTYTACVLF